MCTHNKTNNNNTRKQKWVQHCTFVFYVLCKQNSGNIVEGEPYISGFPLQNKHLTKQWNIPRSDRTTTNLAYLPQQAGIFLLTV